MSVSIRGLLLVALVGVVGFGCGGGVEEDYDTTSDLSSELTAETVIKGRVAAKLIAEVKQVQVVSLAAGGAAQLLASATVRADGTYQVTVPKLFEWVIVRVRSAAGTLLASAIVEGRIVTGGIVTAPPLGEETTLEADVLKQILIQGVALVDVNPVDLRARITLTTAAAVRVAGDYLAQVRALAKAVIAAQRAQIKALAEAGIHLTQNVLLRAQLAAARALNLALHNRLTTPDFSLEATLATFLGRIEASLGRLGVNAQLRWKVEVAANLSFRAVIKAVLGATAVVDAAIRAVANLEARAASLAVEAIVRAANATEAAINLAVAVGAKLRADVAAALNVTAVAQAFARFSASVSGKVNLPLSVCGLVIQVNAVTSLVASTVINVAALAAATLDATLNATFNLLLKVTGALDLDGLVTKVVGGISTLDATIRAQLGLLATITPKAAAVVDLLVISEGSFRLP